MLSKKQILAQPMVAAALAIVSASSIAQQAPPVSGGGGPGGDIGLTPAISSVMDRTYLWWLVRNGYHEFFSVTKDPLATHLQKLAANVPPTVAALAAQGRSYSNGQSFVSQELSVGNYAAGIDVAYENYEGDLRGGGVGVRYSPFVNETRHRGLMVATLRKAAGVRSEAESIHALAADIDPLKLTFTELTKQISRLPPGSRAKDMLVALLNDVDVLDKDIIGSPKDNVPSTGELFGEANVQPAFAFVAGYHRFNTGTVANAGLSWSKLTPMLHTDANHSSPGIYALFSGQDNNIVPRIGRGTNLIRYGVQVALQNKTATKARPDDRWSTRIGAEYDFRTAVDQSPTYALLLRFHSFGNYLNRPYDASNPANGYSPLDVSLFGGIGPNGRGFFGARASLGFGL